MALVPRVFLTAEQIQNRVREMGDQISANYPEGPLYLICDSQRRVHVPGGPVAQHPDAVAHRVHGHFELRARQDHRPAKSKVTKDLDVSIEGHHVLIVEDIVDSGVTLTYLMNVLEQRRPKSLAIATLLDKPERRLRPVDVAYVGFKIPDEFVVGYGLDFAEDYRNLSDICVLGEE